MNNANPETKKTTPGNGSYSEILRTIGQQLKDRQGLIAKRVALTTLPLIIAFVSFIGLVRSEQSLSAVVWVGVVLAVSMTLIWAVITSAIFKIERVIWIDSFFDEKKIDGGKSWAMAKRLFWPALWVNLLIFVRYYLPFSLLYLGTFIAAVKFNDPGSKGQDLMIFILMLVAYPIFTFLYSYYVKFRVRYIWFLFLDTYGTPEFSYGSLFSRTKQLNKAAKSGEVSKMLVSYFGAEVVSAGAETAVAIMLDKTGTGNTAAGKVAGQYTSDVIAANRSYAQLITFYIFYRLSRQVITGELQVVNKHVYGDA